ncbi:ATP-binding protein [Burkholderia gladioli]|uniref:ATP-binding protein n=1 Tax=Burkholderia gladioli TaxID=28095 RepID=UPI00163FE28E|nr:ATP-binding protein [Burkholderia gladioli]
MYLDTNTAFGLDQIVKKFEVAFRSYVSDELIQKIPTAADFSTEINNIEGTFKVSSFLLATRYKGKIGKIKGNATDVYNQISVARGAFLTQTYPGDAPYVSTIVDIFVLFFEKCYSKSSLLRNFSSADELLYNVNSYHRLRNDLSHPGSCQILVEDGVLVSKFVRKIIESLEEKYFWFSPKTELVQLISQFSATINQNPLAIQNLGEIPHQHKKLFCREDEFSKLHDFIIGKENYQRVAGSVIVYGYGGVGKTALVVDFIFRLLQEITDNNNNLKIDFILFYSSKEEFLKRMETTGEIYIEKVDKQISSFNHFVESLCRDLGIEKPTDISERFRRGIVIVDNIENFTATDKSSLFDFIKATPRNVQFILTSRNEEQCEEKLNVQEYREIEKGKRFIKEYLDFEEYSLPLGENDEQELLQASKGNTLILVQSLNSIINQVSTLDAIVASLAPVKTKEAHIIADFMYKNTFDNAIRELESKGYAPRDVIIITSLYKEAIDLYSIGRLCKIDIGSASEISNYLTKCLIFIKGGEYFRLNEFANNFIFIKMLPERIELGKIKDRIAKHKDRINEKIQDLDGMIQSNSKIREMMDDWKPKNYIDKIIIAECFTGFKGFVTAAQKRDRKQCDKLLKEFEENEMITNHPYVQYQKAQILTRLYKSGLYGDAKESLLKSMERAYEDSLESIEFNYPHVRNTKSHGAIQLFFGILLLEDFGDASRSIRHLEEAARILEKPNSKLYFDLRFYLAKAYQKMFQKTNDRAYSRSLDKIIEQTLKNEKMAGRYKFDMARFKRAFGAKARNVANQTNR